jgi:hypothetical protein
MLQGRQARLWPLDNLREQLREVAMLLLHYQTNWVFNFQPAAFRGGANCKKASARCMGFRLQTLENWCDAG